MKAKTLIVDDDDMILQVLEKLLKGAGYDTVTAENGVEALEKIKNEAFDMVITDLVMPEIGGMDVLRETRKLRPDCRVIMMTAFGTMDNTVEAIKLGASDYIVKPFDTSIFLARVGKVLEEARFGERPLRTSIPLGREAVLKSLSNPTRLKVVDLLENESKMRLIQIKEKLGIEDPPKLSFHLRELKSAGILEQDENKIYSLSIEGKKVLDNIRGLN